MNVKSEELAAYYKQRYPLTFTKKPFSNELMERYEKAWHVAKEAATLLKNDFRAR